MHCFLKSLIVIRRYQHFTHRAANHCQSLRLKRRLDIGEPLEYWSYNYDIPTVFVFQVLQMAAEEATPIHAVRRV